MARFLGSLTSNELVEVERRRVTALFASNEGLSQRPQADLTILKQPQGRTDNVAGRAVTAGGNLILDERAEMFIKAERCIPTHMNDGTNSWYRRRALAWAAWSTARRIGSWTTQPIDELKTDWPTRW
jgi:hypothetical protein